MHRVAPVFLLAAVLGCAPSTPATTVRLSRPAATLPPAEVAPASDPLAELAQLRGRAAPPLSGGTLLVTHDGATAIASDPERDRVWVVGLSPLRIVSEIALEERDEPGRAVEDEHERAHVVLRRGGAIVSFDAATGGGVDRRRVCPAPRGIAARGDAVYVACAGGELVTLPASGGDPIAMRRLAPDLRDVGVRSDGSVWATRFRSAEMIEVAGERVATGHIETETITAYNAPYAAAVAWRTFSWSQNGRRAIPLASATRDGGQLMLHQRERKAELSAFVSQYYGAESAAALFGAITTWADGAPQRTVAIASAAGVLPIDAAPLDDGNLAVVFGGFGTVDIVDPRTGFMSNGPLMEAEGKAVAVAWHPSAGLVVQYRSNPGLAVFPHPRQVGGDYLPLGGPLAVDRGFDLFHEATLQGVACASCHPEGADDGHVWQIPELGRRRTQPLTGGILAGAPYHWNGELASFDALMRFVFQTRMGGDPLSEEDVNAIGGWLNGVADPPPPVAADESSVERGRALFADAAVGCERCHSGDRGTDGHSHDVGTGGVFQTPALRGLAMRAPYLHDGCATTIEERFGRCHTEGHGRIAHLDGAQIADLVAYLTSL